MYPPFRIHRSWHMRLARLRYELRPPCLESLISPLLHVVESFSINVLDHGVLIRTRQNPPLRIDGQPSIHGGIRRYKEFVAAYFAILCSFVAVLIAATNGLEVGTDRFPIRVGKNLPVFPLSFLPTAIAFGHSMCSKSSRPYFFQRSENTYRAKSPLLALPGCSRSINPTSCSRRSPSARPFSVNP